jgi:hypothetical protein
MPSSYLNGKRCTIGAAWAKPHRCHSRRSPWEAPCNRMPLAADQEATARVRIAETSTNLSPETSITQSPSDVAVPRAAPNMSLTRRSISPDSRQD